MIKLPHELTIAQVEEYRLEIQPIIDEQSTISLDDSDLARIDTIVVQFILAVVTYISAQGKELKWDSKSKALRQSIEQLGIKEAILIEHLPDH